MTVFISLGGLQQDSANSRYKDATLTSLFARFFRSPAAIQKD